MLDGVSAHVAGASYVELTELLDEASLPLFGLAAASLDDRTAVLSGLLFDTLRLSAETCDYRGLLARPALARRAGIASRVCVTEHGASVALFGHRCRAC